MILSRGNTVDLPRCTAQCAGHDPEIQPYLEYYGLTAGWFAEAYTKPREKLMMIRQLDDRTFVSGQIAPHEVAGLAEHGITMIVNNRPDGEEPDQPLAAEIEDAAAQAGIAYRFVPIMRGIGPADVEEMQEALRAAPATARCSRSAGPERDRRWSALAHREQARRAKIEQRLSQAGFNCGPIAHLL